MRLLIILAVGLISGCAGLVDPSTPVSSLLETRHESVVLQQWDLSCGAAALATILTFQFGDPVPEKQIAQAMLRRTDPLRVQVRGGFSLLDLKRYVDDRGYTGTGYGQLTLQTLSQLGPAVVPLVTKGYSHFVVFRGIINGQVILADPAFGNRIMSRHAFERAWVQKLAFVVAATWDVKHSDRLSASAETVSAPLDAAVRRATTLAALP